MEQAEAEVVPSSSLFEVEVEVWVGVEVEVWVEVGVEIEGVEVEFEVEVISASFLLLRSGGWVGGWRFGE